MPRVTEDFKRRRSNARCTISSRTKKETKETLLSFQIKREIQEKGRRNSEGGFTAHRFIVIHVLQYTETFETLVKEGELFEV